MRFWTAEGVETHKWLPGDAITALAVDMNQGFVIAATMDRAVRVYDPSMAVQEVVQQHVGHSDAVRCIIHVPEKQQYLTASWDRTIRVWRAYQPDGRSSLQSKEEGTATGAVAEEGAAETEDGNPPEEERQLTYAELHPLIEPKCLEKHGRGGHDYFSKKVAAEDPKEKRKKKQSDDAEVRRGGVAGRGGGMGWRDGVAGWDGGMGWRDGVAQGRYIRYTPRPLSGRRYIRYIRYISYTPRPLSGRRPRP